MMAEEIRRLVEQIAASSHAEIATVASVEGSRASVYREGQSVATKPLPVAVGVQPAVGDRVVVLKIGGGDINAGVIVARLTGAGLDAASVNGIEFRVQGGVLQYKAPGGDWKNV